LENSFLDTNHSFIIPGYKSFYYLFLDTNHSFIYSFLDTHYLIIHSWRQNIQLFLHPDIRPFINLLGVYVFIHSSKEENDFKFSKVNLVFKPRCANEIVNQHFPQNILLNLNATCRLIGTSCLTQKILKSYGRFEDW